MIEFQVEVINGISYPLFCLSDCSLNGTYVNDRRVRVIDVATYHYPKAACDLVAASSLG